jgi:hypothetical protein
LALTSSTTFAQVRIDALGAAGSIGVGFILPDYPGLRPTKKKKRGSNWFMWVFVTIVTLYFVDVL